MGLVRGDITRVECDAIVNAANSSLLGGGGVDGAIHTAAGPTLLAECRAIVAEAGPCAPGDAVVTGAGDLRARFVIHTVGPIWDQARAEELDAVLASCYRRSIELANQHGVRSIAFPNIGTGVYRVPKERAARIAISTTRAALDDLGPEATIDRVIFVCFDQENTALYEQLLGGTTSA